MMNVRGLYPTLSSCKRERQFTSRGTAETLYVLPNRAIVKIIDVIHVESIYWVEMIHRGDRGTMLSGHHTRRTSFVQFKLPGADDAIL